MPKNIEVIFDDRRIDHLGYLDADTQAGFYYEPTTGVLRGFSDQQALIKSITDAGLPTGIEDAINKESEYRARIDVMDAKQIAALEEEQRAIFAASQQSVKAILKRRRISYKDLNSLLDLHNAGEIGSIFAYASPNCVGAWAFFPLGWWPKLSWLGWNDRMKSCYNIGGWATLYQHTWFRGKKLYLNLMERRNSIPFGVSSMIL